MQTRYAEIYRYWTRNLCDGGNPFFPYALTEGKKILEIGCGSGNDALRFVIFGAKYHGIDLTFRAVAETKRKVGTLGIVRKMNAEFIDYPDNYFDIVYSFGVIHHTVSPQNVVNEIHRVLKPGGVVYVMLYNKYSFRYLVEIQVLRRILWFLHHPKYKEIRRAIPHPTPAQWLSINTDNVGCPLSRVYTKKQAMKLFNKFGNIRSFTWNKNWFRIVYAQKKLSIKR